MARLLFINPINIRLLSRGSIWILCINYGTNERKQFAINEFISPLATGTLGLVWQREVLELDCCRADRSKIPSLSFWEFFRIRPWFLSQVFLAIYSRHDDATWKSWNYFFDSFWRIMNILPRQFHLRPGMSRSEVDVHLKAPQTQLREVNTTQWILLFCTFSTILTSVTGMGNKDLDKKRPRISSSGTDTESIEAAQDGAYINMTLTEY